MGPQTSIVLRLATKTRHHSIANITAFSLVLIAQAFFFYEHENKFTHRQTDNTQQTPLITLLMTPNTAQISFVITGTQKARQLTDDGATFTSRSLANLWVRGWNSRACLQSVSRRHTAVRRHSAGTFPSPSSPPYTNISSIKLLNIISFTT